MIRSRGPRAENEKGAVLLTVVIALVTLTAIAALVLDLAAVRSNRAASQTVADAAATAGALETKGTDGRTGCETALDYLELNLPDAGTFSGADCLTIPDVCDDTTVSASTTASGGDWIATITFPVRDDSPLLQPSTISDPAQALHPDDGDPCDRFGVSIQSSHQYLFGRILGATSQTSEIHSVAKSWVPPGSDFALNLLLLERFDCDVMTASGSGAAHGGILVDAVFNPNTGLLDTGFIAVDSDATGACGADGVIDVNGANGFIRADGPAGCPSEIGTHPGPMALTVGEGCGEIQLLSPGVPGCNFPSCTSSGTVAPDPTPRTERITRAPIDHRYNCKGAYPFPAGWGIDPCNDASAPHIDSLVAALGGVGTPAGYTSWTGAGYPCNPPGALVVPDDDWHIDCANFRIKDDVIFEGGNLVLDGDIDLTADGRIVVNGDSTTAAPFDPVDDDVIVYFRNGAIRKAGQSSVILHHAMVYLSETSGIKMTGGTGVVYWSAPVDGDFEDLAMWAETLGGSIEFSGGAGLDLEGVFFAPWAEIAYSGNGAQVQVAAQFVSRRLSTSGNGVLVVQPDFDRAVLFPFDPQSQLIR